jgi:signal peptidase
MTKEKSSVTHRVLTIVGTVLCIILIPILLINITLIAKSFINKDEVPSVGGMLPLIVLTDSMHPEIESGDLIICNTAEAKDIKVNDVISFFDPAGTGTSIVTHRVIEIVEENGEIYFRTRGDNNNTEDKELVPAENLVGVYKMRIAGAGHIAMFMQSTAGLIVCVVLPIILLVGYDLVRRRIYEKSKKEDTDALLAELETLRAEKAEKEKSAAVVSNENTEE